MIYTQSTLLWFSIVFWLFDAVMPLHRQTVDAEAFLPSDVQTVDVISDVVLNATLPSGLLLSGTVRTERGVPVALGTVTARSATGMFTGNIVAQGSESFYRAALPPGTYDLDLSVPFLDPDADIPALVYVRSDVVTGFGITADATQNWVVPTLPTLATVTGFVDAQGTAPTSGALRFVSADGGTFTVARFEDVYSARLPLSTYSVRAVLTFTEASVMVDVDAVTHNGNPTIYDILLPNTVALSGTVLDSVGAPISPARVVATVAETAIAVSNDIDFSCRAAAMFSLIPMPLSGTALTRSETGVYRMPLPIDTYRLGVTLGLDLQPGMAPALVDLDTSPSGTLHMAASIPDVTLTTDVTQNLTTPVLPLVVTVSGRVTDALGQPVANAMVKAMTSTLMGVSNTVRFVAMVQTQNDGR